MIELSIDIETYSSVDLLKSGVYPYAEAPDFSLLLIAFAFDHQSIEITEADGQGNMRGRLPQQLTSALTDPNIIKTAYNANFERVCLSKYLGIHLPAEQWRCTAVHSAMLGLPGNLDGVCNALKLERGKMSVGKQLINYFSKPCKPTKTNGDRTRNLPKHSAEKWEVFKEYCMRDVEVEREIKKRISFFKIPDAELKLWFLDQKINDSGILVDKELVHNAIICDQYYTEKMTERAKQVTGLENPNSPAQIKYWMSVRLGREISGIAKEEVSELLKYENDSKVRELLELRQEMAKTSIKKYSAMDNTMCKDGRIRGFLQFYGANRTGRWAGRIVQPQNMPKNYLKDLDLARSLLKEGRYEEIEMLFGSAADTLSQLVRTAFVAGEGRRFIVADFSAIEARVIAWLANEKWRLDVFNTHGKIYEASAAQMFKVPIESITKDSPLRQKGKVAELALGYQGWIGALIRMGALEMGLEQDELEPLVTAWRKSNKNIVSFWGAVEKAVFTAIEEHTTVPLNCLKFIYYKGYLFIRLPSGRLISYFGVSTGAGKKGKKVMRYKGLDQTTKSWESLEAYGGKLVENIVQATARDCLAEAMMALDKRGYKIVMHVHDEVILECGAGEGSLKEVNKIMGVELPWAKGLPLRAEAYETEYYMKD